LPTESTALVSGCGSGIRIEPRNAIDDRLGVPVADFTRLQRAQGPAQFLSKAMCRGEVILGCALGEPQRTGDHPLDASHGINDVGNRVGNDGVQRGPHLAWHSVDHGFHALTQQVTTDTLGSCAAHCGGVYKLGPRSALGVPRVARGLRYEVGEQIVEHCQAIFDSSV
jgi:hypothetical protein